MSVSDTLKRMRDLRGTEHMTARQMNLHSKVMKKIEENLQRSHLRVMVDQIEQERRDRS